ncbi:MAG: protoheme IX farnesyltransferase [Candidatus Saccharimonadales bacterium]
MQGIRAYYRLAKPGIVYGNTVALVAGYMYAVLDTQQFSVVSLTLAVLGTALVMASACVANNIFDKDIDAYMSRTKKRALVTQDISISAASLYSIILLGSGLYALYMISGFAMILGLFGWVTYALVYTYLKRKTYHATLFGTIPGAVPPILGYVAGEGQSWLWTTGILVLMIGWQMVHFYVIAIYRYNDYTKAAVPVVSRVLGIKQTVRAIEWWVLLSIIGIIILGLINALYAVLSLAMLAWWLFVTQRYEQDAMVWSRRVFFSSLLFLVIWLGITSATAIFTLAQ